MEQAQKDIQASLEQTKNQAIAFANEAKEDVRAVDPKDWGLAAGIALILSFLLHIFTKTKEDSAFTFGVLVYGLVTAVLAVLLRKKPINDQFPLMVIIFSVIRLLVDVSALSVLVLSASPVLVNVANEEIKKHINRYSFNLLLLPFRQLKWIGKVDEGIMVSMIIHE